jgi:tetratricopeptide (TPR) repeat protein
MRRSIFGLIGLTVAVVLLAGQALAGDKEEAKQLFDSGLSLMKADDFAAAAANFERSSTLYPTQNSLFNLANCYKAMQRYTEALDVLKRLRQEFSGKLKPEIEQASAQQEAEIRSVVATLNLEVEPPSAKVVIDGRELPAGAAKGSLLMAPGDHTIEASLAGHRSLRRSVHLVSGARKSENMVLELEPGYLIVRSDPSGAAVSVDGVEKATTPLDQALALVPGNHTVALRMAGRKQAERSVEIHAGERQVLEFALAPLDAQTPPVTSVIEPTPTLAASGPQTDKPRTRYWRIAGWSTAAGALIAGGTAMVFWKVFGDGHFSTAQDYAAKYNSSHDQVYRDNGEAEFNAAVRDGNIAIGCGIGAGVLAVASVLAFIADASEQRSNASLSLSPTGLRLGF